MNKKLKKQQAPLHIVGVVSYFGSHLAPPRIGLRFEDGALFRLERGHYNNYVARHAPGVKRWGEHESPEAAKKSAEKLINMSLPYPTEFHSR